MEESQITEQYEDMTSNPGWIIMMFLSLINEVIDWIGALLNVSGVWAIFVLILNLITLSMILGWRIITEGFSFSAIFGSWKQALCLIIEHIPIVGDIFPGWLLFMLGMKKKKKPIPAPAK